MAQHWMVKRNDKEQGPFTSPELKRLAERGRLQPNDWVRRLDSDRIVKAEKVKGLFDSLAAAPSSKKHAGTEESKLLVAEVIEVIDNPPVAEVLAVVEEEESFSNYVDYEDYQVDEDEDLGTLPPPRGRSRRRDRLPRTSRPKPIHRRPARSKQSEEEGEEGPWQLLCYGILAFAFGIGLFVWIGPHEVEITGWGLVTWTLMLLNYIGGRWAILIFFLLGGIAAFVESFKKFARE